MTDQFDSEESTALSKQVKDCEAQHAEQTKILRAELAAKLRKKGIESILCEYTGYGDEGNLESIAFDPEMKAPEKKLEVEKVLWCILAQHFPGFENDEGGYGKIMWNIVTDRIKIEHEQNVVHTDSRIVEEI